MPSAVVDDAVHPDRRGFRGAGWVNVSRWLGPLFSIAQFGVPDFVRNEERLVKRRAFGLMDDEGKVRIKVGPAAIEQRGVGSAGFDCYTEVACYADSELVWGSRVAPALDGLIVQSPSVLPSQLYRVHGYSSRRRFEILCSSTPASCKALSNDTFPGTAGLTADFLARARGASGGRAR